MNNKAGESSLLPVDVALVNMPYVALERPSIGLGTLKSCLAVAGIRAKVYYANIEFARDVGINNYNFVSGSSGTDFLGDWTFAGAAFPDFMPDHSAYIRRLFGIFKGLEPSTIKILAWMVRDSASPFVDRMARTILKDSPKIVGCTSTFQQHVASLALLRRIRELAPEVVTMIGGANCEGPMGEATHLNFPWVDFVVSGEADLLIAPLCRRIMEEGRGLAVDTLPAGVYGPQNRIQGAPKNPIGRPVIDDLDQLPIPDYDEYFETLERIGITDVVEPGLLAETARGCWWGQKKHCTFCGLNGNGMAFRSKSPARVLHELESLSSRYRLNKIAIVDNILDMRYFNSVLPHLAERPSKLQLLFETKSNLKRDQIRQLSDSGVRFIQPGIESMSEEVCRGLNKGNSGWMNIQVLKWAQEYGVYVAWNFLFGLPGEDERPYEEMASWMPMIAHLQPPAEGMNRIRYDRFSFYHNHPEKFGLDLKPYWSYSYNYPLSVESLEGLAYYFEDHSEAGRADRARPRPAVEKLDAQVRAWARLYYDRSPQSLMAGAGSKVRGDRARLDLRIEDGTVFIRDTRPCAVESDIVLSGLEAEILHFCEEAKIHDSMVTHFSGANGGGRSSQEVETAIQELRRLKVVIFVDGKLISLPVAEQQRPMPSFDDFPAGVVRLLKKRFDERASNGVSANIMRGFRLEHTPANASARASEPSVADVIGNP